MNHQDYIDQRDRKLFRFAVISQVLTRIASGQSKSDAVAAVAAMPHPDGAGRTHRVSRRSVYRWLAAYVQSGLSGLEDPPRTQRTEKIDGKLMDFLLKELQADREASLPELISRAREREVVRYDADIVSSTVHRALLRRGVSLLRAKKRRGRDARRFAFPHRMDMVMCDGKHFRAGEKRRKRVALVYMDDASRKVLHIVVGPSESAQLFLRGLFECLKKYGLMTTIYLDHGPGFDAHQTREVTANLGIHLVLGEVAYPQGRGKVERFNRTLGADLLRLLDRNPDIDPHPGSLELRLRHYADQVYAKRPHAGLARKTSDERFFQDTRPLRLIEDGQKLESQFVIQHVRRVSHDHVVSLEGVAYEMPRGTARQKVVLVRPIFDDVLLFQQGDQRIRIHPVDPERNARDPRARPDMVPDAQDSATPAQGAAGHRFDHDFSPLVDAEGGCLPDVPELSDPPHDDLDDDGELAGVPF